MRLVRAIVLGLVMVAVSAVVAEDKKAAKLDPEKLVGSWKIVEGSKAGEKAGADATKGAITLTKDKITLADGDMKFEFSYKVDTKVEPTAIDMEIVQPDALKGAKAKGIIKLDGGKVTLCYHPMNGDRPTKFESTKDNGNYMFVLEAKKAEKK